jgi:hypothetical protein
VHLSRFYLHCNENYRMNDACWGHRGGTALQRFAWRSPARLSHAPSRAPKSLISYQARCCKASIYTEPLELERRGKIADETRASSDMHGIETHLMGLWLLDAHAREA